MDEVTGLIVITYYAFCGFLGWTRRKKGEARSMDDDLHTTSVRCVIILMLMPRLNKVASADIKVAQNLTYQ